MSNKNKLIVILGPTASGKSSLAISLAKKFNGEIINADSRQIYRGMDIATGKPLLTQSSKLKAQSYRSKIENKILSRAYYGKVQGIKHHVLDIVNPDEEFTVGEYKKMAVEVIKDILVRGKMPFLVGGTGLYVQSIVDNLDIPQVPPDKKLRAMIEREITNEGLDFVWQKLLKLDPGVEAVVQKDNPRRVIRAMEVCLKTGRMFTDLRQKGPALFDVLEIGIDVAREKLYKKIDERVEEMLKAGLVDEVEKLVKKGYSWKLPSMSGIGYKEIGEWLEKIPSFAKASAGEENEDLDIAVQKIKWRTHQYARRQMTWFKRDKKINWVKNLKEAEKLVSKFVKPACSPR